MSINLSDIAILNIKGLIMALLPLNYQKYINLKNAKLMQNTDLTEKNGKL